MPRIGARRIGSFDGPQSGGFEAARLALRLHMRRASPLRRRRRASSAVPAVKEPHETSERELFVTAAVTVACLVAAPRAADYPLSLVALASLKSGATSVTSNVVIRVDRLMEESRRTRVTDALKYNGYLGFVPALRTLPVIGSIELAQAEGRHQVRVRDPKDDKGTRLVLVADRPLFFLNADAEKSKAGYELTIVELRIDGDGNATGSMTGAARVKLAPDGTRDARRLRGFAGAADGEQIGAEGIGLRAQVHLCPCTSAPVHLRDLLLDRRRIVLEQLGHRLRQVLLLLLRLGVRVERLADDAAPDQLRAALAAYMSSASCPT